MDNHDKEFLWRLRKDWEKSFPDLPGDWTHYQIKGDDIELAVIDGSNLIEALDVVEKNFGKYKIILVHRSKVSAKGLFVYEENYNHYISSYEDDKISLDNLKMFRDNNTL